MRRSLTLHVLLFLGLALATWALFHVVVDTGFWSPEDFNELQAVAGARANGHLPFAFQPILAGGYPVNPIFALEFHLFGLSPRPYYILNIAVHIVNSFLAYLLVNMLLHDRRSAFMAALLFALSVGSYGKNLMFATGVSSLVYATACLLGTLLYVLNEKRNAGRPMGLYALGFFLIFMCSLFMRGGTFSLLASVVFYNVFFARERERPILHTNLIACLVLAAAAMVMRIAVLHQGSVPVQVDPGAFIRNLPGYLVLMVFPLHQSQLLSTAPALVRGIYAIAPYIRVIVGLSILSYSLFGFIFGNRTIRFYIAWMYVMVVPFSVLRYPSDWLNLRFLYLVSVAFCVLLTTGTLYAYKLLKHRRRRRYLPFLIPAFYVSISIALVLQLDRKNELVARDPSTEQMRTRLAALMER